MGRNLDEIIKSLPADRQKKIKALSEQKVEDMIAHAETLTDFRKAVGKTQAEVAEQLGIKQNAVSQLEKRSDTYVSTLRRFLKTLDLDLELSVVAKNGARINLPNFVPWREAEAAAADAAPFATAAKKVLTRKAAAGSSGRQKATSAKKVVPTSTKRPVAAAAKSPPALRKA